MTQHLYTTVRYVCTKYEPIHLESTPNICTYISFLDATTMPRKKAKLSTRPYFTEAERGTLHNVCPLWEPSHEQIVCLYRLFKSRHTHEAIRQEYANFREQDKGWSVRCARDTARGQTDPALATRRASSQNITPLFTLTAEETTALCSSGTTLLRQSQKALHQQSPSTSTSIHHHIQCEVALVVHTTAGKAFQKLLDDSGFTSRITRALEEAWKSDTRDHRTSRQLGSDLRFTSFLNLMEMDTSPRGQGIEAHVDQDTAIGAVVICLSWDGTSLGLYEVDDQGQRHHVDIPEGTAVWVNGGCVHGVELNHRPTPRVTFNTFVYYAAAVDPTSSDLSRAKSRSKLQAIRAEHADGTRAKRASIATNLKGHEVRKSARFNTTIE